MINETLFHAEQGTFRAVTGGAYNLPNSYGNIVYGATFPVIGTIPLAVTYEGTIKSTGKTVRGTGTQFTRFIEGSYIYAGGVLRQIDYVNSDTMLTLKQAFFPDLTSDTALKICERQYFKKIYAKNTHASAAAVLQEAPLAPGMEMTNGGAPVSFDGTSSQISFNLHQ